MPAARAIATRCMRVVGRAAAGQQRDAGVDDRLLVDDLADRGVLAALAGERGDPGAGRAGQRLAQRGAGVDEGRAGQVQPEHLHQQLVGVRGAVEGAGAGRVVRRGLGLEQLVAADLALGVQLADLAPSRRSAGPEAIGPAGHEDGRQVAEGQRADQQAGHDLVADAEHQRAVEHVVGQRDRGRHRDHVAAVERELHAVAALGDAVAHGGHAAGELRDAAGPDDGLLQRRRVRLEGLVRREHVVVRRHDREVGLGAAAQRLLGGRVGGGEAVGEVGAGQLAAGRAAGRRRRGSGRGTPRGRRALRSTMRAVTSREDGVEGTGSLVGLLPGSAVALEERGGGDRVRCVPAG